MKKQPIKPLQALLGLAIILAIAWTTWSAGNWLLAPSLQVSATQEKHGAITYNAATYNYTATSKDRKEHVAVFRPSLPRDDAALTAAMLQLIGEIYGNHQVTDLTPRIVVRDGLNYIKYTGVNGDFYLLPIKEETGQVDSIRFLKQ